MSTKCQPYEILDIIKEVGLSADTDARTIRLANNLATKILKKREEEGFDHPSFHTPYHIDKLPPQPETTQPQTDSTKPITHPANTSSLAYAKATVAGLSAEEKAELRKWLGA